MFSYFSLHFISIQKSQDFDSVRDIKFVFANKLYFDHVLSFLMGRRINFWGPSTFTILRIHIQMQFGAVYTLLTARWYFLRPKSNSFFYWCCLRLFCMRMISIDLFKTRKRSNVRIEKEINRKKRKNWNVLTRTRHGPYRESLINGHQRV